MAHLNSPSNPGPGMVVHRLADPRPAGAGPGDTRWWPPRLLEPRWLAEHVESFDLLHLHFGFDTATPDSLRAVLDTVHAAGKPVVFTAHDLHNPHFPDDAAHRACLDVLIPGVDELITLTRGAAVEIERRWGRRPTVIAHPHIAPLDRVGAPRTPRDGFVIGLHAKSFRANLDPGAVVDTLARVVASMNDDGDDVTLRIDIDAGDHPEAAKLHAVADRPGVDLRVHPRFTDDELWHYLSVIDVSVLPYRFGTHSGWLEACFDVGTAVIIGDCGHHGDQRPVTQFGFGPDRFDAHSLERAVRSAYLLRDHPPTATRSGREAEREAVAAAHDAVYRRALRHAHTDLTARAS
ncbi:glycosyltransferase [Williamsia sp. MIQD14]|uniref:glycosyltransferase n=1 Tax=Williamsia sp. MIQD14 TaxID=3425703 RepID=UPI003DA055F5